MKKKFIQISQNKVVNSPQKSLSLKKEVEKNNEKLIFKSYQLKKTLPKIKKEKNSYYLLQYEKFFQKKLSIKYNVLPKEYSLMMLDNFIKSKYCHSLSVFKEKLLFYLDEDFLKRYYTINLSIKKIPLLSEFYKSYLNFFCFPTLSDIRLNELIEDMVEKKAKVYYSKNYIQEKVSKHKKKNMDIVVFTKKIRRDLSQTTCLDNLTKTTIPNVTNKNSKSFIMIEKLVNELDLKQTKLSEINNTEKIANSNANSKAIEKKKNFVINFKTMKNVIKKEKNKLDLGKKSILKSSSSPEGRPKPEQNNRSLNFNSNIIEYKNSIKKEKVMMKIHNSKNKIFRKSRNSIKKESSNKITMFDYKTKNPKQNKIKDGLKINLKKIQKNIVLNKRHLKNLKNNILRPKYSRHIYTNSNIDSKEKASINSLKQISSSHSSLNHINKILPENGKIPIKKKVVSRNIKNIINGVNIILTTNNFTNYSKNEINSNYYLTINKKELNSFNKNVPSTSSHKKKDNSNNSNLNQNKAMLKKKNIIFFLMTNNGKRSSKLLSPNNIKSHSVKPKNKTCKRPNKLYIKLINNK